MASRLYPSTRRLFFQVLGAFNRLALDKALAPTWLALSALYVCGLLFLERRQTPWRIQAWFPARAHDALNRLLRTGPISTRAIMAALVRLCRHLPGVGYLVIDEVVIEKSYSKRLAWTGWLYSHTKRSQVYGLAIVVITYCLGAWRIPVAFRLWRPKAACAPKAYQTKVQLAQRMLIELRTQGLNIRYVTFDKLYAASWFCRWLDRQKIVWVGAIDPQTRVVWDGHKQEARHLRGKLKWRSHLGVRAFGRRVYAPAYGQIRLVVTRNRQGNWVYLASNASERQQSDLSQIVCRYASRWSIERLFRESKQSAALEACQCRTDRAWVVHVALSLVGVVVLQLLRRCPEETLGAVKERLQQQVTLGAFCPPTPLKGPGALLSPATA